MPHLIALVTLSVLVFTIPAWSQEAGRRPSPATGDIQIPSEQELEREAVTQPGDPFSTDDAAARKQMDERAKRIDREVMKGICTGC
jgi:hypothetical protein